MTEGQCSGKNDLRVDGIRGRRRIFCVNLDGNDISHSVVKDDSFVLGICINQAD